MILPSSDQHKESVPLLSVHIVSSMATSGDVSDSIKTSWSGASDLRSPFAQGSQILPNEFSPTFPHTSLSPNSDPYFSTPRVHNSQSSTSRTELPRLDMKYLQSTHGQLPITPDSPLHPSNFGNSTAHGQDQIVHGYLSQSTPGSYSTVLVEGNDNRKREFTSDLSGMLPTPITPNTQSGSPTSPVQPVDLTDWITRSYGLDPVAGGAFGNVWKCTYNDGTRLL
ncbi:hypothetical protein F4604DRAFT_745126 [Suillus subluteus]|nr:hypothetical protein F4604DRAFT_745126 [Suillus subluteus]